MCCYGINSRGEGKGFFPIVQIPPADPADHDADALDAGTKSL
jgi:hypothetical protein